MHCLEMSKYISFTDVGYIYKKGFGDVLGINCPDHSVEWQTEFTFTRKNLSIV